MLRDWIVAYDICDDKRRARVLKIMKGHGDHLQYSVFRCALDRMRLTNLKRALLEIINEWEDQVLFIHLGVVKDAPTSKRRVQAIGLPLRQRHRDAKIF